jgi:hypothetical protein
MHHFPWGRPKPDRVLDRLRARITEQTLLTEIPRLAGIGTRPSSCAATAHLVTNIINDRGMDRALDTAGKSTDELLLQINANLVQGKMLAITLANPEHYFVVFRLSEDTVVLLQGWQDTYTIIDWWANRSDGGILSHGLFMSHLRWLTSADANLRVQAARMLFAHRSTDGVAEKFRDRGPSGINTILIGSLGNG